MNRRGQFSIIAALLVAIVLITTVVMTYSTIRNSPVSEQPPIQSAIDETNLAVKEILGFTVGYYGSILKTTGNQTYAKGLATDYLESGLAYATNMHPEWGTSFDLGDSKLYIYWYGNTSYSGGDLSVSYNLTGLGISGITYSTSCSLNVEVLPTLNNQAYLRISKDGSEPLINLGKSNLNFYCYETAQSGWNLVSPPSQPLAYSNGTYQIEIPSGVDVDSYVIQVEDKRGIIVIASSFSVYSINLAWNATTKQTASIHYADNDNSDVDSSPDKGTHSNFTAMQYGPDTVMDTLTEAVTTPAVPEKWMSPFTYEGGGWTNSSNAYDNNTLTRAQVSVPPNSWSPYLTLDSNAISCHKIQYYIGRSQNQVNNVTIDVYNGTWTNVQKGAATWDTWTNVSFSEMSVLKVRFRFYNSQNGQSNDAYVYEAQFLQSGTPQNCELDLEVQWTNVNTSDTNQWLCIYGGTMASEDIRVDVRDSSTWRNLFTDLTTGWNNISVSQYIDSSTFTIRFKGGNEITDAVLDNWKIDAALLNSVEFSTSGMNGITVMEMLQNGTIRWLGENLQLSSQAKPIPPIPVKSIHVSQTVYDVTSEVPFQVEDWSSEYRIPLGLTNNASVFSSRTMLVFLATSNVSRVTLWWNGSDTANQTPYAYTNTYFTGDNVANGVLTNGILSLKIDDSDDHFIVNSTQGSCTATATFMRMNSKNSLYGALPAYSIYHGVVRDIVQQEAEWSNGVSNCPNVYAHIVLTLPAKATFYTYQLRLMFLDSQQDRTITDMCPIKLAVPTGGPQTEDGTISDDPIASSATGLFYNQSALTWEHHWSQFVSAGKGAGIMFTDDANQMLYVFDNIAGNKTGAIRVSNSTSNTIELLPVTISPVSFKYALDVTWYGAIATFDGTNPIYKEVSGVKTGLWMSVEYLPTATVTTGN